MYLECPDSIPRLQENVPDSLPIHKFLFSDEHGRHSKSESKAPFICGITDKSYSVFEVENRFQHLARSLSAELRWQVDQGSEMDKVIGIFSLNTIDVLTVSWASHCLNGVSCPISPLHTAESLAQQLKAAQCKALFTSAPLITSALEAADLAGISRRHVYVLEVAEKYSKGMQTPEDLKTINQLIEEGKHASELPDIDWAAGQGARQTAFLCSSSGTTGYPKIVRITHRNVIANVLQFNAFESTYRDNKPQTVLNLLPLSHALALVGVSHVSVYRGDAVVVLQGFDLHDTLTAIQKHKIDILWMTPPLIVAITDATSIVQTYNLSSVKGVMVGAAALNRETLERFQNIMPGCHMIQGYGLTETTCIASATHRDDIVFGSCGYPLPGTQARLIDADGKEVEDYDRAGELLIRGPSVVPGYYGDDAATATMMTPDGWLRTGDLVQFKKSAKGLGHIFVIDRIKELIKVHGMQVAPAELETFLRLNRLVSDIAIVPIPDDKAGELPRAYVVVSPEALTLDDKEIQDELHAEMTSKFPQYKWLAGGITIVASIPKTASGKVQRNLIKQMARDHYETAKRAREDEMMKASIQVFTYDTDEDEEYLSK